MDIYVAGAAAAFTVDVIVYPLDTLKTRYQSQDYLGAYAPGSKNKALGVRGLYQGIGIVVLATLPAAGVFFSTYEKAKTSFAKVLPAPEALVHSSASAVAEMASCLVLAPAEVVKQNAQMLQRGAGGGGDGNAPQGSTSLRAIRQLAGPGAARRFFSGYTALVARNLPFTGLQFPIFEHVRSAAAFVTTPSDVVKTRMMIMAGTEQQNKGPSERQGSWVVTRQIFRERGARGFFRGALFRSSWTALGSSLYLGSYDMAKLWLRRDKPGVDESEFL
ncbi:hypothetical protein HIM_07616 [Hirsutella minnesotensis 3608]|uniref:Mitochondrial carrier n=1 Tax=Hirsutella minnesotensis 3608 TaxID=1043627 RepID=A0A0F8A466_9HYPO|nr:hypothetical protein HIM_07616 [Hirsutella minnesotensis 3608]